MNIFDSHLLHPEDTTEITETPNAIWYSAAWFPFYASVSKPTKPLEDGTLLPWRWQIRFIGANDSFASGESSSFEVGFERVAEARRAAL